MQSTLIDRIDINRLIPTPPQPVAAAFDGAAGGAAAVVAGGGGREGGGAPAAGRAGGQGYVTAVCVCVCGLRLDGCVSSQLNRPTDPNRRPPKPLTTAALLPVLAAAGSVLLPGAKAAHAYRDLRMSPETRVVAAST